MGLLAQSLHLGRGRQLHWAVSRGSGEAAALENQSRLARHRRKSGSAIVGQDRAGFRVEGRSGMDQDQRRAVEPGQVEIEVAGRGWHLEAGELCSEGGESLP